MLYEVITPSHIQEIPINAGILVISTSRTEKEDKSGVIIKQLLNEAKISVLFTTVIPDKIQAIRSGVIRALETSNCIILTGGVITSYSIHYTKLYE